jgi:pimeloyl-ACP methyl ester carboxylesterase
MRRACAVLAMMSLMHVVSASNITLQKTPAGDEYGYKKTQKPGPLALIFTTDIAASLNDEFTSSGATLSEAGYVNAAIDLPCHGNDAPGRTRQLFDRVTRSRPTGQGLDCWASRIRDSDTDIFAPFLARLSRVIADMQARGLISGQRFAAIGVSRGGYFALRAAAADPRIVDVVALAPVTDLSRLSEFSGQKVNQAVYGLDRFASVFARKRLFLQIGSNDDRVGTREVLHFVDAITTKAGTDPVDLTLSVLPLRGHSTAEHERAAIWVQQRTTASAAAPAPPK